ncbi:MAG: PHP domain-containing protein [Butyrivibrio sp.]|nr:PHP domain-containing protein [Butyrivibrio sp.]
MNVVDLHSHSTASDGTYTPSQLVDYAAEKGLKAIAITDHDTVDGLPEAVARGAQAHPELTVVPGIEYSTVENGGDVHVVGLFVDYKDPSYRAGLQGFINSRIERNKKICEKLTEAGMPITWEELLEANPGAVITRAHFGRMLLQKGYVESIKEVFDKYLGDHCPCYVPREKITPVMAVEQILMGKGLPILAHPMIYGLGSEALDALVKELKEAGLVGIERYYTTYSPSDERRVQELAQKYDLLESGGSDFHGANKPDIDLGTGFGGLKIPEEVYEQLRARHRAMFPDRYQ